LKKSILVHNIGHHDLLLLIKNSNNDISSMLPSSYGFHSISTWLNKIDIGNLISSGVIRNDELYFPEESPLPIQGKILKKIELLNDFQHSNTPLSLVGLKFPIISSVVNEWLSNSPDCENELLVMSSSPAEKELKATATDGIAEILMHFVNEKHPTITVTLSPPFKNNPFLHNDLTAHLDVMKSFINKARNSLVKITNKQLDDPEAWQNLFQVFLSINTGTVPLITGIHSALRNYKPIHIYVTKARQRAKVGISLEANKLDFNTYEHTQAKNLEDMSSEIQSITKEMIIWKNDFTKKKRDDFWHRKGHKAVLAILSFKDKNGKIQYTRSCNLEVSLPTGSLCAERNAIGSALAQHPDIRRNDFLMIAVLSLIDQEGNHINPLAPCGVCNEWLLKFAEVNPDFKVLSYSNPNCDSVYVKQLM